MNMKTITSAELLDILPHRYPFLMIDRVLDYDENNLTAIKNFTVNEPYVQGHFPGNHIMPGVMMIEAMAQASTVLAFKYVEEQMPSEDFFKYMAKGAGILFVGADQIKFKKVVLPGEQLIIYSTLTRNARNIFEFDARIEVDGLIVTEGKLKALGGV
jgi:3-hydroxyacyl-[acyl-carrier-protein] dehydratase